MGVRTAFRNRVVSSIAIAPISSSTRFGATSAEWRMIEGEAIRRLTEELESYGFGVIAPESLRDVLEQENAWDRFEELLDFPNGLETRFEPNVYTQGRPEVTTLQELAGEGLLGVQAILFAEVVYHSSGTCTVDPRDHSRFARVVGRSGDLDKLTSSACVVTHVQAKLVDAASASTMWHNRVLRELRVTDLLPPDELDNVRSAVAELVTGEHGLAPFSRRSGDGATRPVAARP